MDLSLTALIVFSKQERRSRTHSMKIDFQLWQGITFVVGSISCTVGAYARSRIVYEHKFSEYS